MTAAIRFFKTSAISVMSDYKEFGLHFLCFHVFCEDIAPMYVQYIACLHVPHLCRPHLCVLLPPPPLRHPNPTSPHLLPCLQHVCSRTLTLTLQPLL